MPPPSNLTKGEARTRAELIEAISYYVELDLCRGAERLGVEARLDFSARVPGASTFVEAELAGLDELSWNGAPLSLENFDGRRITLPRLRELNSLRVRGESVYERTGLGLRRSEDPADGSTYIYSDFEPYEAHRTFPCFDQPDLKGTFRFRIRVPEEWVALSTEPGQPEEVDRRDNCRWWGFSPSMPLAPYMIGLVAGPFHGEHARRGATPLGLYCARSLAPYLDAEELFRATRQGLDFYEGLFGVRFPFAKYDQVFCPEMVNDGMESPGCVTITDQVLWRGRPTTRQRSLRADLIMHELAHMWFGDLVTMRWWDDLWLNEAFATLMAVFAVDRATEFQDAWVAFATVNKQLASSQDQLGTSHPVIAPVADVESVRANFDTITYEKGAAALRQLVALVGEPSFFAGLHSFLVRHRESNAEFADLVEALEQASGRDLRGWAREWLETVGMNRLGCRVETRASSGGSEITRLTVEQSAAPGQPTLRTHRVRLGQFDWVGASLERVGAAEVEIQGSETEVGELSGRQRPALLLPNDGDLSYLKIRLDPTSLATAEAHLSSIKESLARALIWDLSWDTVCDLEIAAQRFTRMVISHLAAEADTTLATVVLGNVSAAIRRYGSAHRVVSLESEIASLAWDSMAGCPGGGDGQAVWLRAFIGFATAPEQLARCRGWLLEGGLPEGVSLDGELRWSLVQSLAARGAVGGAEIAAALKADPSSTGKVRAAAARAARPVAGAKRAAWSRLNSPDATIEEARAIAARLGGWQHEELLLPYLDGLPKLFDQQLARRGAEFTVQMGTWLARSLAPSQPLADVCRENLSRPQLDPNLRRIFSDFLEDTERYLRARALDEVDSAPG